MKNEYVLQIISEKRSHRCTKRHKFKKNTLCQKNANRELYTWTHTQYFAPKTQYFATKTQKISTETQNFATNMLRAFLIHAYRATKTQKISTETHNFAINMLRAFLIHAYRSAKCAKKKMCKQNETYTHGKTLTKEMQINWKRSSYIQSDQNWKKEQLQV